MSSTIFMHPASIFITAALLMPLLKRLGLQKISLAATPLVAWYVLGRLPETFGVCSYLGMELTFGRVDQMTYLFLHVFVVMALIGSLYNLHMSDPLEHSAAYLYVAGALGVTLSGDYVSLFIFWELMAVSSVFLIWFRRSRRSSGAGFRYLLMHTFGGLVLLAGIFLKYQMTRDLSFVQVPVTAMGLPDYLIMAGFMLNAAVPPLHAWLPDAYPEATVGGAVFLCAFTTKTAVYVLARAFPGSEVLTVLGACMALYGVIYAVIENDARRILAYHIVSQVGYMVCGIGIGTAMGVNGACAHAYAHIIYKALLFMGVGAVLEMTGRSKLSELGGLWRRMPLALVFTVIGGVSISGFPLTSGFVSKSMVVAAAGESHYLIIFLMLMLASVGTFLSVGIKLPYCIWFGKDSGVEAKDPPWNMQLAMLVAAGMCFLIGCYPQYLYRLLPFAVQYEPYTVYHLWETLQVLACTGLGFYLLRKILAPKPVLHLDLDWFYRKGSRVVLWLAANPVSRINDAVGEVYKTVGLRSTVATARVLSSFDKNGIDRFIDGSARHVMIVGEQLRKVQTGKIQHYIGAAFIFLFLLLIAFVLF